MHLFKNSSPEPPIKKLFRLAASVRYNSAHTKALVKNQRIIRRLECIVVP